MSEQSPKLRNTSLVPLSDILEELTHSTPEIIYTLFHIAALGTVDGDDVSIQLESNPKSLLVGEGHPTHKHEWKRMNASKYWRRTQKMSIEIKTLDREEDQNIYGKSVLCA